MDNFLKELIIDLGLQTNQLTIIKNTDRFFYMPEVNAELNNIGVELVSGSALELRVHFELIFKANSQRKFCYLIDNKEDVLEDILYVSVFHDFHITTYFPEFYPDKILKCSYIELCTLFNNKPQKTLTAEETAEYLTKCKVKEESNKTKILEQTKSYFKQFCVSPVSINWEKSLPELSNYVLSAIENELWEDVKSDIEVINDLFQQHIELKYKAHIIPASYVKKPSIVSKVLPYLQFNFNQSDKVALIVIDGMAYWQYLMLSAHFNDTIETTNEVIYSWIPSITQLSRQAIFKGDNPLSSYVQNPTNEAKLWKNFWNNKGVLDAQIAYHYNRLNPDNISNINRLAYVDVSLDDKMHACSDYNDLFDLTQNWIENSEIILNIERLISEDFTVFITTDHGNIQATGLNSLTHRQTLGTNKSGSRSLRHLEYSESWLKDKFLSENIDWKPFLSETDNTIYIKNDYAFTSDSKIITHGGSHILEVLIPFIKLKKNTNE
jgi:hypothetical protein